MEELWPALYGHAIDVNRQIIQPMIAEQEALGYTESREWSELVRALGTVKP